MFGSWKDGQEVSSKADSNCTEFHEGDESSSVLPPGTKVLIKSVVPRKHHSMSSSPDMSHVDKSLLNAVAPLKAYLSFRRRDTFHTPISLLNAMALSKVPSINSTMGVFHKLRLYPSKAMASKKHPREIFRKGHVPTRDNYIHGRGLAKHGTQIGNCGYKGKCRNG